jgi:RNA polymerase sigma factor (sigma-70 family)
MPAPEFPESLAHFRTGDPQAIEDYLRRIDPFLRQVIRLRLIDSRLRRVLDTSDILQSLLKDFLSRKQNDTPPVGATGGLRAYLVAAAHKKILARLRKECRHLGSLPRDWDAVSPEPSPAQQAEQRDLYQVVRARLPEDRRLLFDLCAQGLTWPEIARQVGGKPNALRVRLSRAVRTILNDLNHGVPFGGI